MSYGGATAKTACDRLSKTKYSPEGACSQSEISGKRPAMCAGRPPAASRVSMGSEGGLASPAMSGSVAARDSASRERTG